MKQLPTAEELMTRDANEHSYETWGEMMYDTHEHSQIEYTREVMIEFAKLHVQAALEMAYQRAEVYNKAKFPGDVNYQVEPESILNAYPLENIK